HLTQYRFQIPFLRSSRRIRCGDMGPGRIGTKHRETCTMSRPLRHWSAAFRALRSSQVPARPPRRARRRARPHWLPLEQLEDRMVMTTFNVLNPADSGPGSLRQAILDANTQTGADVIDFAPGLHGTITLTSGELDITDDLTINGPGANVLTVSGGNTYRIFV